MRQGRVDVAFIGLPDRLPGLLERELAVSPFVAVLPVTHPLAGRAEVSLSELAGEQWVDARPGFGNRITLDRELTARGIVRHVPTELSDLGEIPRFVAARLGVAAEQGNVLAVDALLTRWRGQGGIAVPGGTVRRVGTDLRFTRGAGRNEPR